MPIYYKKIKVLRRLGSSLPDLTKKNIKNRLKTPGQHGKIYGENISSYTPFNYKYYKDEQQKIRFNYSLTKKQFFKYYSKYCYNKKNIFEYNEQFLGSLVVRLGFAISISEAKQLITHGYIQVNNNKITVSKFICKLGDEISVKLNNINIRNKIYNRIQQKVIRLKFIKNILAFSQTKILYSKFFLPEYLHLDTTNLIGRIINPIKIIKNNMHIDLLKLNEGVISNGKKK